MKILHVITGLGDGGAEGVLYRLCTATSDDTHHVVSLMDAGKYGPLLEAAGVSVTCLNMPRGRMTFAGLRRLWRLVRETPDAVVQTWMYHADVIGGIVARMAGNRRVVWNVRHTKLDPTVTPRSTRLIARAAGLLSVVVPRSIVLCAEAARASHIKYGYTPRKMVVIHNGYDFSVLSRATPAKDLIALRSTGVPILATVGRFGPQKDHANLFAALGLLAAEGVAFHCILVGTGTEPTNEALATLIDANGVRDRVTTLGARSDVPHIMKALDLHVLASNDEGFPNVVAEAMACGVPCVTTDVGDAALIVDGLGWVAPARSPKRLANAIREALLEREEDPPRWEERGAASALRISERFSLSAMADAYRLVWIAAQSGGDTNTKLPQ